MVYSNNNKHNKWKDKYKKKLTIIITISTVK